MVATIAYSDLRAWLTARAGRTVLVAVDGHGGSGKSAFAGRVAGHTGDVRVVHTDDFANLGITEGLDVERLRRQVIEPLRRGEPARYQRFDWPSRRLAEWHDLKAGGVVIVEGVSSLRREFGQVWDLSVWVETPRDTCLRRGLERDGQAARHLWETWLAEEDRYIARDDPRVKADLVVDGAPSEAHDPAREFVVLEDRRHVAEGRWPM